MDVGIEVQLEKPDAFLLIKETLTRMGVASKKEKKLFQSCHILHKRGKYYICHFKELFKLDGKEATLTEEDLKRRNLISSLLEEWGLLKVLDSSVMENKLPLNFIKILSYNDKDKWELVPKYNIGSKRKGDK